MGAKIKDIDSSEMRPIMLKDFDDAFFQAACVHAHVVRMCWQIDT